MGFHATDSCPVASRPAADGHSACKHGRRHVPSETVCLFWQVAQSGFGLGFRLWSPHVSYPTVRRETALL